MAWFERFVDPIVVPELLTLRDAAEYITALPKAEQYAADEVDSAPQVFGRTPPPLTCGHRGQPYQIPGVRRLDRCQRFGRRCRSRGTATASGNRSAAVMPIPGETFSKRHT